jgi:hypothetical protein
MFFVFVFFGEDAGHRNFCAVMLAMPIPDASIVQDFCHAVLAEQTEKFTAISSKRPISFWWFKKLSHLSICRRP